MSIQKYNSTAIPFANKCMKLQFKMNMRLSKRSMKYLKGSICDNNKINHLGEKKGKNMDNK